jgi:hypothetical protein
LGENQAENQLVGSHPCENQLKTTKPETFYKQKEPDGFSHENPNPVLKVLNQFGSLVPLELLIWGC